MSIRDDRLALVCSGSVVQRVEGVTLYFIIRVSLPEQTKFIHCVILQIVVHHPTDMFNPVIG